MCPTTTQPNKKPTQIQQRTTKKQQEATYIQQTRVALMVPIIIAIGKTFVCKVKSSSYNITRAVALIAPSESAILWDVVLLARVVFLLLFVWVRVGFRLASRWVLGRVCACGCGGWVFAGLQANEADTPTEFPAHSKRGAFQHAFEPVRWYVWCSASRYVHTNIGHVRAAQIVASKSGHNKAPLFHTSLWSSP